MERLQLPSVVAREGDAVVLDVGVLGDWAFQGHAGIVEPMTTDTMTDSGEVTYGCIM